MVSRVPFLDGDEHAAARRGDFAVGRQLGFDGALAALDGDGARDEFDGFVHGRGGAELDVELRRDGAGRGALAACFHQGVSRGPVAMAIQQSTDDAAVEYVFEGLVILRGLELGDDSVAIHEAFEL